MFRKGVGVWVGVGGRLAVVVAHLKLLIVIRLPFLCPCSFAVCHHTTYPTYSCLTPPPHTDLTGNGKRQADPRGEDWLPLLNSAKLKRKI